MLGGAIFSVLLWASSTCLRVQRRTGSRTPAARDPAHRSGAQADPGPSGHRGALRCPSAPGPPLQAGPRKMAAGPRWFLQDLPPGKQEARAWGGLTGSRVPSPSWPHPTPRAAPGCEHQVTVGRATTGPPPQARRGGPRAVRSRARGALLFPGRVAVGESLILSEPPVVAKWYAPYHGLA